MSVFAEELLELTMCNSKSWTVDAFQFIELIPDAVCLLDDEGLMCHANSSFFSTIAQLGRLKNKDFLKSIVHPDDRERMYKLIEEAILSKDVGTFIKTFPHCKTIVYRGPKAYNCYDEGSSIVSVSSKHYFDWTVSCGFGFVMLSGKMVDHEGSSNTTSTSPSPMADPSTITYAETTEQDGPDSSLSSGLLASCAKERDFVLASFMDELREGLRSCRDSILKLEPHIRARTSVNNASMKIDRLIFRSDDVASIFEYERNLTGMIQESVNVDSMIQSIIYSEEHRALVDASGIRFTYSCTPQDADCLQVLVQKVPLQRAIFHLIENSMLYSISNSVVDIKLNIDPDFPRMGVSRVSFTVGNQAKTTPPNFKKILDNFRACSTINSTPLAKLKALSIYQDEGRPDIGIGLGLVFNSLKLLNGELLYTGRDRFCQFCIVFEAPVVERLGDVSDLKPSIMNSTTDGTNLTALAQRKILVVDDSPVCLRVVNKIVQNLGYDTELSENGLAALEILKSRACEFAGVLMDFRMPIMDGLVATAKCRELNIQTPIILLTVESANLESSAKEAGANTVLNKPPNSSDLRKTFDFIGI